MKCPNCGSSLPPEDKFCGDCGAARPELSSAFIHAERRFLELSALYEQGDLSEADYEAALKKLVVTDDNGRYWMIGAKTREWYIYDGTEWVRSDPALAAMVSRKAHSGFRWKWVGLALGAILLVSIIALGIWAQQSLRTRETKVTTTEPTIVAALDPGSAEDTPTFTPSPTETTTPTLTPSPTNTPSPTITPIPTSTSRPSATPTASPPPSRTPTPLPTPTASPTSPPPTRTSTPRTSLKPGYVADFEQPQTWRRGDQSYGEFSASGEQAKAGSKAGMLQYNFPAVNNNFVVFEAQPGIALPGQPSGLEAWVYGDDSGHFLNIWVRDAAGERRSYTFGQIRHEGWQRMQAWFNDQGGWPNGHIDGPDNGILDYPAKFNAIVLDGVPDGRASSGSIYIDEIKTTQEPIPEETATVPTPGALPTQQVGEPASPATLSGHIAFPVFAPERGVYDIYVANTDGSGMQRVIDYASQPALNPDGRRMAFRRWQIDDRGVVVMDTFGGNQKRLTNFLEDGLPSWSPDGQNLVFLSRRESDRKTRIYGVKVTGDSDWELSHDGGPVFGEYPTWMPGGPIVYRTTWPEHGLATMDSDGGGFRLIYKDGSVTAPAVSPDGQFITFMSQRNGGWNIYRINADGSGLLRLTPNDANDGLPAWSPGGGHIAFVSDRGGRWAIWSVRPDGNTLQKLFDMPGSPEGYVTDEPGYSSRGWLEERISWGP